MKKILTLIFLTTLLLSGCTKPATSESGEFTNIDDLGREVTYSTDRIYADSYQGQLMYLDANLVGSDMTYTSTTWPKQKVDEIVNTGEDMEAVAALNPTLIITFHEDFVDQYEMIAPTYYIEYGKDDPIEIVIRLGKLLGLEDKASSIEDKFYKRIDTISSLIDQPNLTYTIAESESDYIYLMGDNWARGGFILYKYLGLEGSKLGEETYIHNDPTYILTDEEGFLSYDSDVLLLVSNDPDNSLVKTSQAYDTLTAVENDNVYVMDPNFAWYDDPYAIEAQLDFFEQLFSEDL